MAEKVSIEINAKDNASGNIKKVTMNLRDMGEKIGNVGRSMSMAFTVPVVGLIAGLTKLGSTASKTLADYRANLANAMAITDPEKQAEALRAVRAEYAGISSETKRAAAAYDSLQASLAPVKTQFQEIGATLLETLVPVLKDMMPTIMGVVGNISDAVKWFANLDAGSKNLVLGFGAVVVGAGPILIIFGDIIKTVGTLNTLIPGLTGFMWKLAPSIWASIGPLALLAGSILFLVKVITDNWTTLLQMFKLFGYAVTGVAPTNAGMPAASTPGLFNVGQYLPGKASGGRVTAGRGYKVGENGEESFFPDRSGMILPHGSGAGGVNVYLTYAPTVSLASKLEAETKLAPYIKAALRKAGY